MWSILLNVTVSEQSDQLTALQYATQRTDLVVKPWGKYREWTISWWWLYVFYAVKVVEWIPSNNVILVRINTELQRVIRSDGALAQPKIIFLEMAKPSKIRTSWSRFSSPSVHSLPPSVSLIQLVTYTHIASLFRSPSHFDFTACMLWHSFSVFFFFLSALTFPSFSLYAHIFVFSSVGQSS